MQYRLETQKFGFKTIIVTKLQRNDFYLSGFFVIVFNDLANSRSPERENSDELHTT